MSASTVVKLKTDWSVDCADAGQYEAMKAVLQELGYTFEEFDRYESSYFTVCSSDMTAGGATQADGEEEHHFTTMLDFLVFHYEAEDEVANQLALMEQQAA